MYGPVKFVCCMIILRHLVLGYRRHGRLAAQPTKLFAYCIHVSLSACFLLMRIEVYIMSLVNFVGSLLVLSPSKSFLIVVHHYESLIILQLVARHRLKRTEWIPITYAAT